MPIDQAIRDGRYERSSSRLSVCRVDCCTFLVELDGALIVFDPWLHDPARYAPLWWSRHGEPLIIDALPIPDLLLISQDAPDHCDPRAIDALPRHVPVGAPATVSKRLARSGFDTASLSPGDVRSVGPCAVTVLPGSHPGVLRQNGYLVERNGVAVLFLADTAATPELTEALKSLRRPPDLLMISSTGFALRFYGQIVMGPEEAAVMVAQVGARDVVPMRTLMHEVTGGPIGRLIVKAFIPPDEAFRRFEDALRERTDGVRVHRLERGER